MANHLWQEHFGPLASVALPAIIACIIVSWFVGLAVDRLWLNPLARIPGPRLAALTGLYEFHYECLLAGKYIFEIERMHQRYGPIVRISPREVHINDPDFFTQLHSVTSKLEKDWWYYRFIGNSDAAFGTSNAKQHAARRKAMSRFFSQSAILSLEDSVNQCVQRLCERVKEHQDAKIPVNLSNGYRCLAGDIVSQYSLPEGRHNLDSIDFASEYNRRARSISYIAVWHRFFGFIIPLFLRTPRWIVAKISTQGALQAFDFRANLRQQAYQVVHGEKSKTTERGGETILHGIMESDLPPSDKTVDRLRQEALTVVGAGTETTVTIADCKGLPVQGGALDTITYYVLSNPEILKKLKAELASAFPHPTNTITYEAARRLPYLSAVISEGLRMAGSVSGRLARSNPTAPIIYGSFTLPPGTVVSMTIRDLHTNPTIYPEPATFNPERWMDASDRKRLDAYYVPFSKGSRSCIGKDLAMVELYLALANMFSRFDMKLFETSERDIKMEHDFFAPFGPSDSKGLQVMIG